MTTICVDPGVGGGIVVAVGKELWKVFPMPETQAELARELRLAIATSDRTRLFVEHVSGYIGEAHPGSRMFVFGENFGFVKGFCAGVGIACEAIGPFSWQQRLGIGLRSERKDKPEWKRALKKEALRRFPDWKDSITLATADAFLIWDFCRIHRPWRGKTAAKP